jgi:hypothetical protein
MLLGEARPFGDERQPCQALALLFLPDREHWILAAGSATGGVALVTSRGERGRPPEPWVAYQDRLHETAVGALALALCPHDRRAQTPSALALLASCCRGSVRLSRVFDEGERLEVAWEQAVRMFLPCMLSKGRGFSPWPPSTLCEFKRPDGTQVKPLQTPRAAVFDPTGMALAVGVGKDVLVMETGYGSRRATGWRLQVWHVA